MEHLSCRQIEADKTCTKCGVTHPATPEYFHRYNRLKSGLQLWCKACKKEYRREYRKANIEKERQQVDEWRKANPERVQARRKRHFEANRDRERETGKQWARKNTEKIRKSNKKWVMANPEKACEIKRRYTAKSKNRLSHSIGSRISRSLAAGKSGCHWEELVDFTIDGLIAHLESQFQPGMTWDNYGEWHIDHIRPIASFDFTSYEDLEFKECWALDNLQPLWAKDNTRKGSKHKEEAAVG